MRMAIKFGVITLKYDPETGKWSCADKKKEKLAEVFTLLFSVSPESMNYEPVKGYNLVHFVGKEMGGDVVPIPFESKPGVIY